MNFTVWLLIIILCSGCSSVFYDPKPAARQHCCDKSLSHKDYWLASKSGATLHLRQHFSQSAKRGSIIHFHGNSGNLQQTAEKVRWLTHYGFDVFQLDYSQFGHSTGWANRKNIEKDAQTYLTEVIRLLETDSSPKIIIATSMGGAIALDGLIQTELEPHFDLLLIDSAFDHYSTLAIEVSSRYWGGKMLSQLIPLFVDDSRSPVNSAKALKQLPVIVSHCDTDALISTERATVLFEAIPTSKAFWQLHGCAHARGFTSEHAHNQQQLIAILDRLAERSPSDAFLASLVSKTESPAHGRAFQDH